MKRNTWFGVMLLLATAAATPGTASPDAPHFDLEKSVPENGASVHMVSEVRLWFTQAPQAETTSIRVVNEAGEAVPTGDVAQSEDDAKVFSVSLAGGLAAGDYTVAWRAMGADGHVVRGDLAFTVSSH